MLQAIAKLILRAGGWKMVGDIPAEKRAVVIAAPHTSNWDGFWALVYKVAVQLDIHFFAKRSLFWFPLNVVLRALGGVPLDRKRAGSAVDQAIEMFYRIAEGADVPVALGFLDYGKRRIGFGPTLKLSGDWHKDLDFCRDFYKDVQGRWPEKAGPVTFPHDPRIVNGRKKKATP